MSANTSPVRLSPNIPRFSPQLPPPLVVNQVNQAVSVNPSTGQSNVNAIIADGLKRAAINSGTLTNQLQRELADLHLNKTYVSLFKLNYKTRPALALEAYEIIRRYLITGMAYDSKDRNFYSPSNFLYRDQVIELGLAQADVSLTANLVYGNNSNRNQLDFQYEIWQTAVNYPEYRRELLAYFDQLGRNNWVYQALTGTNPAITQLLNNQLPANFRSQPELVNFAMTFHLDWVWTRLSNADRVEFEHGRTQTQLWPVQIEQLNLRVAQKNDSATAGVLRDLNLYNNWVWAAWTLLSQGTAAYVKLVTRWAEDTQPGDNTSLTLVTIQIINYLVKLVADNGLKFSLEQWRQIFEAILNAYGSRPHLLAFFQNVNLPAKAIMAMLYPELKYDLATSLRDLGDYDQTHDLATIMADFVLTPQDLVQLGFDQGPNGTRPVQAGNQIGPNGDKFVYLPYLATLLPWYKGDLSVLQAFINWLVANPESEFDILIVSPYVYLAAVGYDLTVPQHNHRVNWVGINQAPILAYFLRKFYHKRLPSLVVNPNRVAALTNRLMVRQSIVEPVV